jgi:tetratricopeptide (TPR) repeat protein
MNEILSPKNITDEAKSLYKVGNYQAAAQAYEAARQSFLLNDDVLMAAEMANNSSVAYLQAGENEAALQALEGIEEVFRQAGDFKRQAMTIGNQGAAFEAINHLEEAEKAYWRAAKIFKDLGENELRLPIMQSISALQLRTGRQLQAVASMYAGVEIISKPTLKQRFLKGLLGIPMQIINKQTDKLSDGSNNYS